MSRLALKLDKDSRLPTAILKEVARIDGQGLGAVRQRLANGEPILTSEIFPSGDPGRAPALLALLAMLEESAIGYTGYELLGGQQLVPAGKYFEIDHGKLANMIAAHDRSLETQRNLASLEDGEPDEDG